jgi:hypothetical protein
MSGLTGNNILAGSSGQGAYKIEQSLRFNDDDSAYLTRTPASAGNRKTWTWSGWVKRGNLNTYQVIFSTEAGAGNNNCFLLAFTSANQLDAYDYTSGAVYRLSSNNVYRDTSAWYHILVAFDTTQATSSNRVKFYVNGQQITSFSLATYPSLNYDGYVNATNAHYVATQHTSSAVNSLDGYLAEVNFIDGQALTPSDFGETDLLTNQWIPKKYVGTYGTNGFYLNFSDSASLGADSSGNGNNFTPTNLAATDQVLDSPSNNFATLNLLSKEFSYAASDSITLSEGSLRFDATLGGETNSTFGVLSGKWYAEFYAATAMYPMLCGVKKSGTIKYNDYPRVHIDSGGTIKNNGVQTQDPSPDFAVGDIFGVALDMDAGSVQFYRNNSVWGSSESLSSATEPMSFFVGNGTTATRTIYANFGQDSSFAGTKTAQNNTDANGIGDFYHAPPSGYLALCENNLPDPSIALPEDHFNTYLWTGDNSSPRSITGIGFQPDLTWIKRRSAAKDHALFDAVRGSTLKLESNQTSVELVGEQGKIDSFDSDGFTVSTGTTDNSQVNISGSTYVAWNWKADNTSGSSNTDGTITSTVSANTTAGFSIVTYTGDANGSSTVGHGLGAAPDVVIVKRRDVADGWPVYHSSLGVSKVIELHSTSGEQAGSNYWGSAITSTTFGLSAGGSNNRSGSSNVAYCFAEVEGYSKFGSYTGNGSTDGPFVYTGFRPAFVMVKRTDAADSWGMFDGVRDTDNAVDALLRAESSNTEASMVSLVSYPFADFLSNGFKIRNISTIDNTSSGTYIYMAFAEKPFKYSNAR